MLMEKALHIVVLAPLAVFLASLVAARCIGTLGRFLAVQFYSCLSATMCFIVLGICEIVATTQDNDPLVTAGILIYGGTAMVLRYLLWRIYRPAR